MAFTSTTALTGVRTGSIPVAFADVNTLRSHFGGQLQPVPGFQGAYVARGRAGNQLFVDTRTFVPTQTKVNAVWRAAFGELPAGYAPHLIFEPGPSATYLVVIAIIAILIGLLLPAVQKVRSAATTTSAGVTVPLDAVPQSLRWN